MISWHKVGQKVVCVDVSRREDHWPDACLDDLEVGAVYTIAAVELCLNVRHEMCVGFALVERPNEEWNFDPRHFQPVYPQALERLRGLLVPTLETAQRVFEPVI